MKAQLVNKLVALLVLSCGFLPSSVFADDSSKIYLNGVKSSVKLINVKGNTEGSGSVINLGEGYILTNWHVVRGATDMLVVFPMWNKDRPVAEEEKYRSQMLKIAQPAKVVASDQKVDLAIIKLVDPKKIPQGTLAVKFADDSPLPGAKLISIGNPGASDGLWIYTPGEVRSVYKKKWESSDGRKIIGAHDCRIIEATSPTSAGDSGGPCFNDKGEQVGVTQGGLKANFAQGFSYFVDATEVKTFLKVRKVAFEGVVKDAPSTDVVVKDPEPMTPEKKSPPPKTDPTAEKKAKDEKAAASMLNLIRPLARDPDRQTFALEKLKILINKYPNTEAAKEAQAMADKIK